VLKRIHEHLDGAFEHHLFEAALRSLADQEHPLRFNNFAYSIRELVRHVLARLAPDDAVRRCPWFRPETEKADQVTRRQRAAYAIHGGLQPQYVMESLDVEIEEPLKALVAALNTLSKHTHIEPDTFDMDAAQVDRLSDETLGTLAALFDTTLACRDAVRRALWDHIDRELVQRTLDETIVDIDILATHHIVEGIDLGEVKVIAVDHERAKFRATGSLDCELQWGSNGDMRRGDGATLAESFPFSCELSSPVAAPEQLTIDEGSLQVDTTSWFGNHS
jgi:hypothetical protein